MKKVPKKYRLPLTFTFIVSSMGFMFSYSNYIEILDPMFFAMIMIISILPTLGVYDKVLAENYTDHAYNHISIIILFSLMYLVDHYEIYNFSKDIYEFTVGLGVFYFILFIFSVAWDAGLKLKEY